MHRCYIARKAGRLVRELRQKMSWHHKRPMFQVSQVRWDMQPYYLQLQPNNDSVKPKLLPLLSRESTSNEILVVLRFLFKSNES